MILFNQNKLDPIIKLKLKEKADRDIPAIITLKAPMSNRLRKSISKNMGKLKYEYKYMNAFAGQFTLEGIDKLSELPEVMRVSYDRKANICMDKAAGVIGLDRSAPYNLTGKGVGIAVIDTGVYPHPDLMRPYKVVAAFKDYIHLNELPYDDNGHGTHLCGVIAGSGSMSDGKYRGIAPGSKIIMIKAFNSVGVGSFSDIIAGIGWALENRDKFNIRLLVLPFGADPIVPHTADPLCHACRAACESGLIVVASAGNRGPHQGTITTPGIEPSIITAGCCECRDENIRNWKISDFSGRGDRKGSPVKPELIAPGVGIVSLAADRSFMPEAGRKGTPSVSLEKPYCEMTGSSISAAVTAGCISLLFEKMGNISCVDLKGILKLSCQTLNESNISQGHGVISMKKLLS